MKTEDCICYKKTYNTIYTFIAIHTRMYNKTIIKQNSWCLNGPISMHFFYVTKLSDFGTF